MNIRSVAIHAVIHRDWNVGIQCAQVGTPKPSLLPYPGPRYMVIPRHLSNQPYKLAHQPHYGVPKVPARNIRRLFVSEPYQVYGAPYRFAGPTNVALTLALTEAVSEVLGG